MSGVTAMSDFSAGRDDGPVPPAGVFFSCEPCRVAECAVLADAVPVSAFPPVSAHAVAVTPSTPIDTPAATVTVCAARFQPD